MGHLVNPISFRLGINVFWSLSMACYSKKKYRSLISKSYDLNSIFFWFFNLKFIKNLGFSYLYFKGSFLYKSLYIFIYLQYYNFNNKNLNKIYKLLFKNKNLENKFKLKKWEKPKKKNKNPFFPFFSVGFFMKGYFKYPFKAKNNYNFIYSLMNKNYIKIFLSSHFDYYVYNRSYNSLLKFKINKKKRELRRRIYFLYKSLKIFQNLNKLGYGIITRNLIKFLKNYLWKAYKKPCLDDITLLRNIFNFIRKTWEKKKYKIDIFYKNNTCIYSILNRFVYHNRLINKKEKFFFKVLLKKKNLKKLNLGRILRKNFFFLKRNNLFLFLLNLNDTLKKNSNYFLKIFGFSNSIIIGSKNFQNQIIDNSFNLKKVKEKKINKLYNLKLLKEDYKFIIKDYFNFYKKRKRKKLMKPISKKILHPILLNRQIMLDEMSLALKKQKALIREKSKSEFNYLFFLLKKSKKKPKKSKKKKVINTKLIKKRVINNNNFSLLNKYLFSEKINIFNNKLRLKKNAFFLKYIEVLRSRHYIKKKIYMKKSKTYNHFTIWSSIKRKKSNKKVKKYKKKLKKSEKKVKGGKVKKKKIFLIYKVKIRRLLRKKKKRGYLRKKKKKKLFKKIRRFKKFNIIKKKKKNIINKLKRNILINLFKKSFYKKKNIKKFYINKIINYLKLKIIFLYSNDNLYFNDKLLDNSYNKKIYRNYYLLKKKKRLIIRNYYNILKDNVKNINSILNYKNDLNKEKVFISINDFFSLKLAKLYEKSRKNMDELNFARDSSFGNKDKLIARKKKKRNRLSRRIKKAKKKQSNREPYSLEKKKLVYLKKKKKKFIIIKKFLFIFYFLDIMKKKRKYNFFIKYILKKLVFINFKNCQFNICLLEPEMFNSKFILDYMIKNKDSSRLISKLKRLKKNYSRGFYKNHIIGFRLAISGRFSRASRSRYIWFSKGYVPLNTIDVKIDYSQGLLKTRFGMCGIKVWLYKK